MRKSEPAREQEHLTFFLSSCFYRTRLTARNLCQAGTGIFLELASELQHKTPLYLLLSQNTLALRSTELLAAVTA